MRHNQNRRPRGRNRKGPNPLTRSYESNGPDVKVRGTPAHIAEKYSTLARDALSSGDPVAAENYHQHAEHYNRIVMAAQAQQAAQAQTENQQRDGDNRDTDSGDQQRNERNERNNDGRSGYRGNNRRNERGSSAESSGAKADHRDQPSNTPSETNADQPPMPAANGTEGAAIAETDAPQPELQAPNSDSNGDNPVAAVDATQANGATTGAPDSKPNGRRRRSAPKTAKTENVVEAKSEPEADKKPADDKSTTPDGQAALSAFPD